MADKVVDLTLVADYTPAPDPPDPQAEFDLEFTSYTVTEGLGFSFKILRSIRTDQVLDIDWGFTNVSVVPISGTERFQIGETEVTVNATAQLVDTDEQGTLDLANPVIVSGPDAQPILGTNNSAAVFINDIQQTENRNLIIDNDFEADTLDTSNIQPDPNGVYRNVVSYLFGWGEWGDPITITDIENTNPAVAHYTGTIVYDNDSFPPGYTLGEITSGMTEMSGRLFRPKNINAGAGTFWMFQDAQDDSGIPGRDDVLGDWGIDATGYGNFTGQVTAKAYKQIPVSEIWNDGIAPYNRSISDYPYYPNFKIVDSNFIPPTNSIGAADPVPAQTGTRFLSTMISKRIDHSRGEDGTTYANNNQNKPRWQLTQGNDALKLKYTDTIWVGFAVMLPSNFDNQTISRNNEQAWTGIAELQDDPSTEQANQWIFGISRDSNDPVGYMRWYFAPYINGIDPASGPYEWATGTPVENDIGLWTTFIMKFKADPGGSNGEVKVWKSTGPYLNQLMQRDMTLWYEFTGDVGIIPTFPEGYDAGLKAYKYSWLALDGTGDEEIQWMGFDNWRFGTFETHGTQYRDVHPYYENEPGMLPAGADHVIGLSDTDWSATAHNVQAGDVIEIEGGQREPLVIRDITMATSSLPVTIRSDSNTQNIIGRAVAGGSGYILRFTNCKHFILDGTNTPGETYGIKVCSLVGNDLPTAYLAMREQCSDYEVKNVHVDGLDAGKSSSTPIGIFHNFAETVADPDNPSEWRENIRIHHCLVENIPGEGFYIGSNVVEEIPFRTTEIDNNIVRNTGRDGINLKSCIDGTCEIHHNNISSCGLWTVEYAGGQDGIAIFEGVCNVFANTISDIAENGIKQQTWARNNPPTMPVTDIYNNVITRVGIGSDPILQEGIGIRITSGAADQGANVFNNTIVDTEDDGIQFGASVRASACYNNIICEHGNLSVDVPGQVNASNNMAGSIKALRFNDPDNDDFSLLEASPAINAATGTPPSVDLNGNTRPNGPASDIGAYEFDLNITGTIYIIEPSTTLAQFAAMNFSFGDGVFFRAGNTWSLTSQSDRIQCQSGVYYGRVGPGDNPIINGNGTNVGGTVTFSQDFRGTVHIGDFGNVGVADVTWNGIDVEGSYSFGFFIHSSIRPRLMNCKSHDNDGCGVGLMGITDAYVGYVEIYNITDHPHEAISVATSSNTGSSNGFLIEHIFSHDNKFACIDVKGGSINGEIRYSRFHNTNNDPMTYSERAQNVIWHHNYIYDNSQTYYENGRTKATFSFGIEPLGHQDTRRVDGMQFYNNVIRLSSARMLNIWVKVWCHPSEGDTVPPDLSGGDPPWYGSNVGVAEQVMNNIHIHHNTFIEGGFIDQSWVGVIQSADNRSDDYNGYQDYHRDTLDWSNIVVEDNIFFDCYSSKAINHDGDLTFTTVRNNLYETGMDSEQIGDNPIYSSNPNFVDRPNGDFRTLSGDAVGAGHDGSTVGANWDVAESGVEWL